MPAEEKQEKTDVFLNGRKLLICGRGFTDQDTETAGSLPEQRPCPVIFWPMSEEHGASINDAAKYVCEKVNALTRAQDRYLLAAFSITDWNMELSPWEAEIPEIGQSFGGGASGTLQWILGEAIPYVESFLKNTESEAGADSRIRRPYFLAGYSLAGLFSLWALTAACGKAIFAGAAGCSSTMWFPGWLDYAKDQAALHKTEQETGISVYLSLGGKEHLTSNPFIAGIQDATKAYEAVIREDPAVRRHVLEMNKGGHFADPDGRVAKGIAWLMKNLM